MKKIYSYLLSLIIGIYLLNILTFFVFGKTALVKQILNDTHTSYQQFQWTKNLNIASNLDLKSNQIALIEEFYNGTKADFKYLEVEEFDGVEEIFSSQDKFLHFLDGEFQLWCFTYSIDESEKIAEYYHKYRRTYVWLFFKWVKIDEKFLGIS